MSPDAFNSLFALCIGFAFAGMLSSGYQTMAERPAGFGLLGEGVAPKTFAAVPFLVFAAPFIIMRNTLRGAKIERRRFEFVMMATVLCGILEHDVRYVFPDDAARCRRAGLSIGPARLIRWLRLCQGLLQRRPFYYGDLRTRRAGA